MASPIEAIFFDFDGVLLESADVKTETIATVIPELSPSQRGALRRYHLENVGLSRYVKFEWAYRELLGRELSPEESERLGREYSRMVYDRVRRAPFVPGARAALETLSRSHPLFVVSGTPTEEVAALAEDRSIEPHFREIWGSPKTKPEILEDLLERYDLTPNRSLFVGDGYTDYEAARACGLRFLARDTPDQRALWDRLAPARVSDLEALPRIVRTGKLPGG